MNYRFKASYTACQSWLVQGDDTITSDLRRGMDRKAHAWM